MLTDLVALKNGHFLGSPIVAKRVCCMFLWCCSTMK